jgi:hypothetical protein
MPIATRAAIALLAASVVTAATLQSSAQAQAARTAVIEFRAFGADGQPVLDLAASEITLRVDGRQRTLQSLELVRDQAAAAASAALPEPFATNTQSARRGDVIVFLDEDSIMTGREPPLKAAILEMIRALAPSDRVTLMSMRQGGLHVALTDHSASARAALDRFAGHSDTGETEDRLNCRSRIAVQMMRTALEGHAGQPSPTVLLVSAGFGAPPRGGGTRMSGMSGPCPPLQTSELQELGAAAAAVNARVYVLSAVDATASKIPRETLSTGLEALAGVLRGDTLYMIGGSPVEMTRIARETSVYYLARFVPDPADRTGAPQRAELTVARAGVKVKAPASVTPAKVNSAVSPNDMLRGAAGYSDLKLRAAAFSSRGDGAGKVRLVVLFEPIDHGVKLTSAAVGLYDAKGKLTRWTAEASDLARTPAVGGIILPVGKYRMRVAAVDSSGRAGTVDTDVEADLQPAGPVTLSGMMTGVSAQDGGFVPRLQFDGDKGAFGYFEIYGLPKSAAVTVRLELAKSPDGPALVGDDVPLASGPSDDVKIAFSGYAIDGMPPGDVVMRALVSIDGKPTARLLRTIRKVR